jgi:hypothetical protein
MGRVILANCPPSEAFRTDKGISEVYEQNDRNDPTKYVVEYHAFSLSQFVAGERVEHASPEEDGAHHEEGDIEHGNSPGHGITADNTESIRLAIEPSLKARRD